jgi:DNA mismatch repair ATPase MutS
LFQDAIVSEKMFMIKADYDDELMKFGKRKTDTKEEIDAAVKVVARYIGLEEKSIKLEFTNQHGYTYRVTMKVKNIFHIPYARHYNPLLI